MKRVAAVAALGALTALAAAVPASAAPVVREATGANAAAITPAVDAFEEEVGADNCPADSGCRRIVWDGVPDERSDPSFMPEGQFRGAGALFTTPGTGVQVSADDDSADTGPFDDPDEIQFRAVDGTYDEAFEPFSAQRLFTSIGSNVIDTRFVVAGTDTTADTNAFGVVFSDVNVEGPTKMEYFAPDGSSLGSFPVPATPGEQTFSFLGVIFDAGERIARVRITQGGAALATGVTDLAPADLVTTDNFVFGEPQELVPPQPPEDELDRTAPDLDLNGVKKKLSAKKFLRGVKFSVEPNEEAQIDVALVAKAKQAELSASATRDLLLDSDSFDFSTEAREGKLKPNKRLVGKAKKFKARVQIEAIDRAGNKGTETQSIKVKTKKKKQ